MLNALCTMSPCRQRFPHSIKNQGLGFRGVPKCLHQVIHGFFVLEPLRNDGNQGLGFWGVPKCLHQVIHGFFVLEPLRNDGEKVRVLHHAARCRIQNLYADYCQLFSVKV